MSTAFKIDKLGNSSIRYNLALFKKDESEPCATGYFVHVYVDRLTRKPRQLPHQFREKLENLK